MCSTRSSRPVSTRSSKRSRENHCFTLLFAFGETTKFAHSSDGAASSAVDVRISHVSPEFKRESNETSRPFTRAPMQVCPTSVCTPYAKSIGVASSGRAITRPFGVKTNNSSCSRSVFRLSRNCRGSDTSSCQSIMRLSQSMSVLATPSLYDQCDATPHSARWCMSRERICTSIGLPPGPITVVCSD